ncbi:transposase [Chryseobacterium sp. ISL-6]|uniref:transposase n=1 Tax=Chryseobacterium sp. ISL-6 TaxID=2819143 RepID=UPI001BE66BD8|nr:transposase [Chryseobacterium sp. ISL-6]MBT2620600.1 transposase [Chryseobacterium sp. ISL-6]
MFKEIHVGELIKKRVEELNIDESRICAFFSLSSEEIDDMYKKKDMDSMYMLMWSKLLEYDFFRLYSQHLILYAPARGSLDGVGKSHVLPTFRKNLYTKEIIDFIVELVHTRQKSEADITREYNIPKTTINKWCKKYGKNEINNTPNK